MALPSGDLPFPCAFGAVCAEWGIPPVEAAAALADDDIGASLPGFALASALHETQYTRLFAS